jgi:hypothetical protein
MKTKDSLFTRSPAGMTNALNFALNSRIFNPAATNTFVDSKLNTSQQYT